MTAQPKLRPPEAEPALVTEFMEWFSFADAGARVTYHTGFLAADRHDAAIGALADRVLKLADAGRLHLLQRRIGLMEFAYIAEKRSSAHGQA